MNSAPSRAPLGVLQGALPFEDRPARKVVLGQLAEHRGEIDLPVAQRAEAACPVDPRRIARIDALPAGRIELGVLGVEHPDAVVINVDVIEIVECLQHVVVGS